VRVTGPPEMTDGPGAAVYWRMAPVSDELFVLDESVLLGVFAWGDVAGESPLGVAGVFAESPEDWSGLLTPGAAPIVSPVVAVESPLFVLGCIPDAWPVVDEPVSGFTRVWACTATEDNSTPAAKNGISLLLINMEDLLLV